MRRAVGLIGYGRFGALAARYLSRLADVVVFDPRGGTLAGSRVRRGTLGEAAACPLVVLAVPISRMRRVLRAIAPLVRPGALVADVCSVKTKPLAWMREALPRSVAILGTHPLFGPDSDTGTLRGQRLVVCPSRGGRRALPLLRRIARAQGVEIILMTPPAHDRLMAETLLVTHYVGRLLHGAGLAARFPATASYEHLQVVVRTALRDSEQLFLDMWRFNPYAPRVRRALERSARALGKRTRGED
ncbi:MAG TPA: prephenate dehydrogenase [Bacteroidota bacterium]|nr:prephenate dehydrogenase [Bacteroidota bacterium]